MGKTEFWKSRVERFAIRAVAMASALLVTTAVTAHADETSDAPRPRPRAAVDVDALVERIVPAPLAEHRIPGAAVTVVTGGQTVFSKGYGLADVEHRTPMDADETGLFPASVAKLFTAMAASQLIEQGELTPTPM